jgi:TonB family protein
MELALNQEKNHKKVFKIFIAVSVIFHLAFLVSKVPSLDIKNALSDKNDEFKLKVLLNSRSKTKRQIVQTEQNKDQVKNNKKAYLGKKDNFVARETKAVKVGTFKQAAKGVRDGQQKKISQSAQKKRKNFKNIKIADLAVKPNFKRMDNMLKKQQNSQAMKGLNNGKSKQAGLSQANDFVKDVALGDFTKLNTQEFAFYGFYHRIRQKLEQFWGVNIQDQAEKIMKSGRSIASGQNHLTSLVININSKGEIIKVKIKSTSGIKELDEAAIKSFNQAGPFPNPPKGMIKDGVATIEWGFVVNT